MKPRIRIIYHVRRRTAAEQLESRARAILAEAAERRGERSLTVRTLERQIALALGQLVETRAVHERLRASITRDELYLETEILQRTPRPPIYEDPRLAERDMLRSRLLRLSQERRRLSLVEADSRRELESRLLELVGRWEVVQ